MRKTMKRWVALAALIAVLCFAMAAQAEVTSSAQAFATDQLNAESAILIDARSGEVLVSKNSRVRMYPASTTKIMTLMLGLESGIPLDQPVTIPEEAADIPQGSSVIPIKPGDIMTYRDLLYSFMLSSGNDGANAVAVLAGGSIEGFVAMMNARAAELGCEGTHFVNAHGYHDENHYTTAQDLATMARAAMSQPTFREIVAAPVWDTTVKRGDRTGTAAIPTKNELLRSESEYYYADCTGIKTGHHRKAGQCVVASAERDGVELICVVLNCKEESEKWIDAKRLFEYGFAQYTPVAVGDLLEEARTRFAEVRIDNAATDDAAGGDMTLNLSDVTGSETLQMIRSGEEGRRRAIDGLMESVNVEWLRDLTAPVAEGEILGRMTCVSTDGTTITASLTAPRAVDAFEAPHPDGNPDLTDETRLPDRKRSAALPLLLALLALVVIALAAVYLRQVQRRREARRRARQRRKPVRRSALGSAAGHYRRGYMPRGRDPRR